MEAIVKSISEEWDDLQKARTLGAKDKQPRKKRMEAYGNKGMKNTPWRKEFKSQEHFEKWMDKNQGDVTILGTRDIED